MHPYWWVQGTFKRSASFSLFHHCSSIAASQVGGLYYWTVAMLVWCKHWSIIIRTSKTLHTRFLSNPLPLFENGLPLLLFSVVNLNTVCFIPPHRCLFYSKRSSSFVRRHKRDHRQGWGQTTRQTSIRRDGQSDGWRCTQVRQMQGRRESQTRR